MRPFPYSELARKDNPRNSFNKMQQPLPPFPIIISPLSIIFILSVSFYNFSQWWHHFSCQLHKFIIHSLFSLFVCAMEINKTFFAFILQEKLVVFVEASEGELVSRFMTEFLKQQMQLNPCGIFWSFLIYLFFQMH